MGKRSGFQRRPFDDYATPFEAVPPLMPFLDGVKTFAEPCCGDGALVGHLESFGLDCVLANDILYGADALTSAPLLYEGADIICTNPPWDRSLLHPLIWHLSRIRPTWLLFDADWAHTRQAGWLLGWCSDIVAVGRLKWIAGSPFTGKDNCCWHRFDREPAGGIRFHGRRR